MDFFKPTKVKLVFLVQWIAFVLLELVRGELNAWRQILVATYPLLVFYLLACLFSFLRERTTHLARGWRLLALPLCLAGIDQLTKAAVVVSIPTRASIPVVEGWLHLAHRPNPYGSWVLSLLKWQGLSSAVLALMATLALLCSIVFHRYYVANHRSSVWADLAFVGLFAGCAGWLSDTALRGHIVDFIVLPGLLAVDLKDFYLDVGAAALCAEVLDNPAVSLRPKGWRQDGSDLLVLALQVGRFAVRELHSLWQAGERSARDLSAHLSGKNRGK